MSPGIRPDFRNDAEAAAFWDTHDSTAYLHELRPVKLTFARPSLIRLWITERLVDELKANGK